MRSLIILFLSICLLNVSCAQETKDAENSKVMIIGTPTVATLAKSTSDSESDLNVITMRGLYLVKLESIETVFGDFDREELWVQLMAHDRSAIVHRGKIYVLLDGSDIDGSPRALYWDVPGDLVCLPNALIEKEGLNQILIEGDFFETPLSKCGAF